MNFPQEVSRFTRSKFAFNWKKLANYTAWKVSVYRFFWSVFSHIRTEYGDICSISPYSVQMRESTEKKNSEYGHFLRSVIPRVFLKFDFNEDFYLTYSKGLHL